MAVREWLREQTIRMQRACRSGAFLALAVYALYRLLAYAGYVTNLGLGPESLAYISNVPFMVGAGVGKLATCGVVLGCYLAGRLRPRGLGVRVPLALIAVGYALAALLPSGLILEGAASLALGLFWGLAVTVVGLAAIEAFVDEPSPMAVIVQLACGSLVLAAGSYAWGLLPPPLASLVGIALTVVLAVLFERERRRAALAVAEGEAAGEDRTASGEQAVPGGRTAAAPDAAPGDNGPRERILRLRTTLSGCATPILAASFFELVVGLVNMYAFTNRGSFTVSAQAPLEGSLIAAAVVISFVAVTARIPRARFMYLVVFPAAIAVFLILPYFGELWGAPLSTVIYAAGATTTLMTTFCIIRAARRACDLIYGVAALATAAMRLCLLVGLFLGWRLGTLDEGSAFLHLSLVCVVCVYLLGIVVLWWGLRNSRRAPEVKVVEVVVQRNAPTFEEAVAERVAELTSAHCLSPRERDVLVGLAQGNTAASIAHDLHLSTSTAQGYIKSLYIKLGVNKKQQVIDLFRR